MISVENVETAGWEPALRGMRNPLESWDRADSLFDVEVENTLSDPETGDVVSSETVCKPAILGPNDESLMRRLIGQGSSDHCKFRRMLAIYCDITGPLYWWKEFSTYRVGTVMNSCSTMHTLMNRPFEMNDFSFDQLPGYRHEVKQFVPEIDDEDEELWVYIDDEYDVSNFGRVRHNLKNGSRILGGSHHKDGYIFVTLHGKQMPVHRLVARYFLPDSYFDGLVVNHKDGNKKNNHVDNLEWVTQGENVRHSIDNNLQPKPSKKYTGKFTDEQRAEIKALWNNGTYSKRELAKKYGVSHTCVNDIINEKYQYASEENLYETIARPWVDTLNELRDSYLREEDPEAKKVIWYSLIQQLPSSWNQRRTLMLNYEVMASIYKSRRNHKLQEWHDFIDAMVGELPYPWIFTGEGC